MRQGQFELLLKTDGGLALEERVFEGKPTARGESGTEYFVQVNYYKDDNGNYPQVENLTYRLYVDGESVNYSLNVLIQSHSHEPVSRTFWGFRKNDTEVLAFKFAPTTTISSKSTTISAEHEKKLGSIKLVVHRADFAKDETEQRSAFQFRESPGQRSILETDKFWKQPSITTVGGRLLSGKLNFSPTGRKVIRSELVTTLELHYHAGDIVELLDRIHNSSEIATATRSSSSAGRSAPDVVDLTRERHAANSATRTSARWTLDLTQEDDGDASPPSRRGVSRLLDLTGDDAQSTTGRRPNPSTPESAGPYWIKRPRA
jgi:hypothetical protein